MDDFLPGDTVEFIDDKTRGVVISIKDNQTLLVDIDDGLEIPVLKTHVVKIGGSENKQVKNIRSIYNDEFEKKVTDKNLPNEIFIAVVKNEELNDYRFYLINNTGDFFFFTFYQIDNEVFRGTSKGELHSGDYCLLTQINLNETSKFPAFQLMALPFRNIFNKNPEPLIFKFRPDGEKLSRNRRFLNILNSEASLFEIHTTPHEATIEKAKIEIRETPVKEIRDLDEVPYTIDLHIKEINPDYKLMSNSEIFHFQVEYFKNALEKAIAMNYSKIIFIHGIGVNSLKNKMIEHLKQVPDVKSFHDADVRKFGYGAMEVEIKN